MKVAIKITILFIIMNASAWFTTEKASAQVSVSFQLFYDELSPYGYWVDNPNYGYVWVPNVAPGFSPYGTNGHWVYTNVGWTWVSDYPWGWAPFHYGRWYTDATYGPMWVPDNEWGPGWVSWRRSDGYYGWAPIEPGISINVAYSNGYVIPNDRWTFVRDRDFGRTNYNNYYVSRSSNTTIINNSTVINNVQRDNTSNVSYNAGPDRSEVQKRTGSPVSPVVLKEGSKPGQKLSNGELQIYKPRVEKNSSAGHKPAPAKVADLKDVTPAAQRNAETQPSKTSQPGKTQPSNHQGNDQPVKQQPAHQQQNGQPVKQQPTQQQHNNQPVKQQPSQQQHHDQPAKQQPSQQQHKEQPAKQQPSQQQHNEQPVQQQPSQQQHNDQPAKQQPSQQQHKEQPAKQQPSQQQHKEQPAKQQPSQQQHKEQPAKQQPSHEQKKEQQINDQQPVKQQEQSEPPKNKEEEKNPH